MAGSSGFNLDALLSDGASVVSSAPRTGGSDRRGGDTHGEGSSSLYKSSHRRRRKAGSGDAYNCNDVSSLLSRSTKMTTATKNSNNNSFNFLNGDAQDAVFVPHSFELQQQPSPHHHHPRQQQHHLYQHQHQTTQSQFPRRRKKKPFSNQDNFVQYLVRLVRVPLLVLLLLLFWGPMLFHSSYFSESNGNTFTGANRNFRKTPAIISRVLSGRTNPDARIGSASEDPNHHNNNNNNNNREDGSGKQDAHHSALQQKQQQHRSKQNDLRGAKAAEGTDFKLPPRQGEDDQMLDPNSLSEDEKQDLRISFVAPHHYEQQQQQEQQEQKLEYEGPQQNQHQRHNTQNDSKQQVLSPLEQYQLRTQQEEEQQLQHYHDQQTLQGDSYEEDQRPKVQSKTLPPEQHNMFEPIGYTQATSPERIPHLLASGFSNVWEPLEQTDTPIFWHIPKNGGTTVADVMTHCLGLVSASNIGTTEGHDQESELMVRTYHDKGRYVNVDVASIQGIEHAKQLGLAQSGLADVIVLHRLHEGAVLFDPSHKARLFCLFRHPVQRAISMFYYLQQAKWEPTYDPALATMTLSDYAHSNKVEDNWVTRFLVHQYTGKLERDRVEIAKQIMRNKMVVGLLENFQESLKRFELYFDWWETKIRQGDPARAVQCQQNKARVSQNKMKHPHPETSDPAYQRLLQLNWADLELYEYAKVLFEEQHELVKSKDTSMI